MNKKGVVEIVFGVLVFSVIAGSMIIGTYVLQDESNSNINSNVNNLNYVGDIESKIFYDSSCINGILKENRVLFNSMSIALRSGFEYSSVCKNE